MKPLTYTLKLIASLSLCASITNTHAQSVDFSFGLEAGTTFNPTLRTLDPIINTIMPGEDIISFAFENNILIGMDQFGDNNTFETDLGGIVIDNSDFDVGSVSPNSLGGQNITFINGDLVLRLLSDFDSTSSTLINNFTTDFAASGTATLQVQTTNLSFQSGDPIFAPNGAFSNEGTLLVDFEVPLVDFIETVEAIAQLETEQEISENTNKVTSGIVNNHIAYAVSSAFQPGVDTNTNQDAQVSLNSNKISASADTSNYSPDTFWGKHTYSALSEDGNNLGYTSDLYQFVGGLDKRLGNFFIGSALSYVYGETNQSGNNSSTHTIGVTPYAAYRINNFLFASALAGYNYSSINGTQGRRDADVHNYSAEVSLNAFKAINDFVVKGRGGLRYTHNYTSLKGTIDADYDQLTWIGDIEFGYQINDNFNVFSGILYEYIDKEATVGTSIGAVNAATHDGVAYFRGGVNYKYSESIKFSLDASSDLNDEDNDILSFGAGINIAL